METAGDMSTLASPLHSSLNVLGCMAALIGFTSAIYYFTHPLNWFARHHIMWLFAASNHAYLASVLLLLWQQCTSQRGSQGLSLQSQRMMLVAILSRAAFAVNGASFHNLVELGITSAASAGLVLVLEPKIAKSVPHPMGGTFSGALPDSFPPVDKLAIIGCFAAGIFCRFTDANSVSVYLIVANSLQALALLPQRALLLKTRSLPALTSHAFILASLSAALRLFMWMLLCLEHEFHTWMMLPDFVHIGLIADFALIYARALRSQGIEGMMRQQSVQILASDAV